MPAYLRARACGGAVRHVPEMPGVPDDAPGLRAANARLRELLAERDERLAERDAEIGLLREQLAALQSQVARQPGPSKPSPPFQGQPWIPETG